MIMKKMKYIVWFVWIIFLCWMVFAESWKGIVSPWFLWFSSLFTKKSPKQFPKLPLLSGEVSPQWTTSKGFPLIEIAWVTYVDGYLIVNKTYPLPYDFVPSDTFEEATRKDDCLRCIHSTAYQAFETMKSDAKKEWINIFIVSWYRSYRKQKNLYSAYVQRDGKKNADRYSARPWNSEHQSSLSFDLNSVSNDFWNTKEWKWLDQNAYKYWFILRYPKNKEKETWYMYEWWHFRYVGEFLSKKLRNWWDWISLEEYFWLSSEYPS